VVVSVFRVSGTSRRSGRFRNEWQGQAGSRPVQGCTGQQQHSLPLPWGWAHWAQGREPGRGAGAHRALQPSSALKGTRLKAQQEAEQGETVVDFAKEAGGQQPARSCGCCTSTYGRSSRRQASAAAPCMVHAAGESSGSGSPGCQHQLHALEQRQHLVTSSGGGSPGSVPGVSGMHQDRAPIRAGRERLPPGGWRLQQG